MAFVKLDCGMLDSSIWVDREARELFITALLMAKPYQLEKETAQIEVMGFDETGFKVPPGWYGLIEAAGIGIVDRAHMDREVGLAALKRLGAPEYQSRTPDFDGRRLVRIAGGYLALNYQLYRQKDHTAAKRAKKYRLNKSGKRRSRGGENAEAAYVKAEAAGATLEQLDRIVTESLPGAMQ